MSGDSAIFGALVISVFPFALALLLVFEGRLRVRFGWTRYATTLATAHVTDFLWLFTVLAGLVINEALKQTFYAYEAKGFNDAHWAFLLLFILLVARFHLGILPYFRQVYGENAQADWKLFFFDFSTRMCQYIFLFWASQGLKTNDVRELFILLLLVIAANLTWYWGLSWLGATWLTEALAPWARSVAAIAACFLGVWLAAGALAMPLKQWPLEPVWLKGLVGSLFYLVPLVIVVMARFWNMQGYMPERTGE